MAEPNFFIVGASKAGTTSLAHALGEHPEIFMSQPKEPNFFNRFDDFDEIDASSRKGYLEIFDRVQNEKVIGEASVSYLSSSNAAENIYRFNPNSKILISLRNPLDRIVSMYEMYVRHGLDQSFHFATKQDPWLTRQNLYAPSIELFLNVFPRENLKVIEFSNIQNDWDNTMLEILEFLSVGRMEIRKATKRNTGGLPSSSVFSVLTNRNLVEFGKRVIPKRWHEQVDLNIKKLAFKKSRIPDDLLEELKVCFSQDASNLDNLLCSDFQDRWFAQK